MPDREPGDTRGWILHEVIATHAGRVSTHYEECWRYHAGCLARLLLDVDAYDDKPEHRRTATRDEEDT
jgi:hypothetical protein